MKRTITPLIAGLLICLGGCTEYDVFWHPETAKYQDHFLENMPRDIFEKEPEFVDEGIFFFLEVREMAWEPYHRSFICFYSRNKASIDVMRVQATSINSKKPATIEVDKTVPIATLKPKSGLFTGYISTLYRGVDHADEVFSAQTVTITIEYKLEKGTETKKMSFEVIRKRVKDIAWPT
ncbi:hypothetical protein BVY04_00910 [bacterium M21]|nr:hypothetical protein BVY04_00910 [bacterium M21]